jgi:tripartite-type tricarboxylate transporter receptor subunit TctC
MEKNIKKTSARERQALRVGLYILFLFFCFSDVYAADETFPNKSVTIMVNYAPGGPMDIQGQLLGDKLAEVLRQPFVRVHKPGGGGTLGASLAARAKPDGYTLFTATSVSLVLSPIVQKLDYSLEDFNLLGIHGKGVNIFAVRSQSSWKTLSDFTDEAKRKPGMTVGSYGKLTHADFTIESFSRQAGIKLNHVPFKSCAEAMTSLLGGHLDAYVCASTLGQMDAGTVRVLAVADQERSKLLPEVKTFKECGYNVVFPTYCSLAVARKTPKKVMDVLTSGIQEIYKKYPKEISDGLMRIDHLPYFCDAEQSLKIFKKEYEVLFSAAKELNAVAK